MIALKITKAMILFHQSFFSVLYPGDSGRRVWWRWWWRRWWRSSGGTGGPGPQGGVAGSGGAAYRAVGHFALWFLW